MIKSDEVTLRSNVQRPIVRADAKRTTLAQALKAFPTASHHWPTMTHSPLDWVGLFASDRQRRLLAGVAGRSQRTGQDLAELRNRLTEQEEQVVEKLDLRHHQTVGHCREQRREMLQRWDDAEEALTVYYETQTVTTRDALSHLTAKFRKKLADNKADIERKVEARCDAVAHQYENRRNMPGQQMRKEHLQIDESLGPITEEIEWTRALTIRRLDHLPDVPIVDPKAVTDDNSITQPTPTSVRESVDAVAILTRQLKESNRLMQSGAASKTVDSFYLPFGVAVFILIWVGIVTLIQPKDLLLWMSASIPIGGVIGFSIYGILLMPLRRMTRRVYPNSERIFREANRCADAGRRIAKKVADETSAELVARRDAHLVAAARWKTEQTEEAEKRAMEEHGAAKGNLEAELKKIGDTFTVKFNQVGAKMRGDADSLAESISETLSREEAEKLATRKTLAQQREDELKRLETRLRSGLIHALQRIDLTADRLAERFPSWTRVAAAPMIQDAELPCLPVGALQIESSLRKTLGLATSSATGTNGHGTGNFPSLANVRTSLASHPAIAHQDVARSLPQSMPIALHRRLHAGLIIEAPPAFLDQAIDLAHSMLWRAISGVAAGRAKLTLIDPIGRGQNFSSLMAMTDHEPDLVGHRVWTGERQIEQRLGELAHRAEDILQVNLRDRFERIEQYNEIAGSLAEPYRLIAAIGFPESLTRDSYKSLKAIIDSALRCGSWTILVCDQTRPWPAEMPLPATPRMMRLTIDDNGRWIHWTPEFASLPFVPADSPPATLRPELIRKIGVAATQAARVEVPFDRIVVDDAEAQSGKLGGANGHHSGGVPTVNLPTETRDSSTTLRIPLGVQGAGRIQSLNLGEGVKQHVLIAGKTGSGKSSLLHTILTAGAAYYPPDQLHFYLLDFKKGVEFKVYADLPLPHARVIGIESEREFGRSVLQRLDADLQQRGEWFRAAGAQELSEYRSRTGNVLPRVMLVVDEFQELFVRDDRLAADCAMLLDRLVRQGRSFGMHVILSSQSLAGAHSLPRATLGQMAVRVAMQCSESDAALILSDDNTAAKFISRPGEAIYNDAGGLLEGNQPFQVAYLNNEHHQRWLAEIAARDAAAVASLPLPVIFEGNRPCRWVPQLAEAAMQPPASVSNAPGTLRGLLGEAVEIGPPTSLVLTRETGRNVLVVAPPESTDGVLASILTGAVAMAKRAHGSIELNYFDGSPIGQESFAMWLDQSALGAIVVKPRDSEKQIAAIAEEVRSRVENDQTDLPPKLVVINPLNRFSDFKQDESFSFSLDAAAKVSGSAALQSVLRDGPAVGIFTIVCCSSAETVSRWLPRQSRHDVQQRILGRVNASDSAALIDSAEAANLSPATMLIYDDSDGTSHKFRACDLPSPPDIQTWLETILVEAQK